MAIKQGILIFLVLMNCTASLAKNDISVFVTDSHEGPVCVLSQNRVYFTTQPDYKKNQYSSIKYIDLKTKKIHILMKNANNPNSMYLTRDGTSLLVAEQGTKLSNGAISLINLNTKDKQILVNNYKNLPFNSPNKVIESKSGLIYFSDPNYGYLQGFKQKPKLANAIYAYNPKTKILTQLSTHFSLPHGLALSLDEKILYIGDTRADDGIHPIDYKFSHHLFAAELKTPTQIEKINLFAVITPGIPDGVITGPRGYLYIATGNGVQLYSDKGKLVQHIILNKVAYNLTLCGDKLYVTTNGAIYEINIGDH